MVLYLSLADALETHEAFELRQAHEVDERDARRRGVLQEALEGRLRVDAEASFRQLGVEDLEARAPWVCNEGPRGLVPAPLFQPVWKSKFYGAFDAIDATPARWRGGAGSSPLDGAFLHRFQLLEDAADVGRVVGQG